MSRIERRWGVEGIEYGFVYRWTDSGNSRPLGRPSSSLKKRQRRVRYYVGSHWGKFDDGYVCSSRATNAAHKRRPQDFTRRIIAVVTTNRKDLLAAEQAALDKIPRSHFGTRAYNVSTKVHKPWWARGSKLKSKTVAKLKKAWQDPERREEASRVASARRASPELKAKMSKSARRRWRDPEERRRQSDTKKGCKPWNTGTKGVVVAWNKGVSTGPMSARQKRQISATLTGRARSEEARRAISAGAKKRWKSAAYRAKISASRMASRIGGRLKITPKQAVRIRRMYASGKYALGELSSEFGVSTAYVHGVIHDPRWDAAIESKQATTRRKQCPQSASRR